MFKNIEKILVSEDIILEDAIRILNDGGQQLLLVVDDQRKLKGLLTDGDLRRHLLCHGSFRIPISEVMNRNYVSLNIRERQKAESIIENTKCNHVPIVDDKGNLVDLVTFQDLMKHYSTEKENYVVIMAGGKGTRLEPVTKIIPKPLIPISNKTIIEVVIDKFNRFGFKNFIATLNYKKEMIKAYFAENKKDCNITFLEEPFYMGTVGSLSLLKDKLKETFILSNCDIFADLDYEGMLLWHKKYNADMTLLGLRKEIDIPYGVLKVNQDNYVTEIQEKPNYRFLISAGVYILEPDVIDMIPKNECFQMNQLIEKALQLRKKIACYPIHGNWYDTGQFLEYEKTVLKLKDFDI